MKTQRMSRSAENHNARKDMAIRGRASVSRAELLAPDLVLTGRRFRRANKLTSAEASALEIALRGAIGNAVGTTLSVSVGDLSRMMTARHVS